MQSKAEKDKRRMKELGKCYAEGLYQGVNKTINLPVNITSILKKRS